jgi:O-antigen/teichoic acid export membrane protein
MYTIYGKKEAGEFYSRVLNYYLIVVGGIALVMSIFAQEIVAVLAAETYLEAYRVIPLIAFSYVAYGTYFITTVGLNLKEKTYYLPWIVGAAAAVNLLLNYLLVPPYGMMGAAVAVFLSHIALVVINYFMNQRFYRVTYDIRKICLLCFFFVFTIFLFSCPITVNILVKVLYVCGYCIFTWIMLLDEKERRNLLDMTPFSISKNTRKNP